MKLLVSACIGAALAMVTIAIFRKIGWEVEAMDFVGRLALGIAFMKIVDNASEKFYYANRR